MTYLEAAIVVLGESEEPMHYSDIIDEILKRELITTNAISPKDSLYTSFVEEMQRDTPKVKKTAPGVFTLSSRDVDDSIRVASYARVPHYPSYEQARAFLRCLAGWPRADMLKMRADVEGQTGSPQAQLDWTEPDVWISERLDGDSRTLATHLWTQSKGLVNPRHATGAWALVNRYDLIATDEDGVLHITDEGNEFLTENLGHNERCIDEYEGLLFLLSVIADRDQFAPRDLLSTWMEWLLERSKIRSENSARSYLYARIHNLEARGLVERQSGVQYSITESGMSYLDLEVVEDEEKPQLVQQIRRLRLQQDELVKQQLREHLGQMPWQDFEQLVARLLEAMGYEEVEVTSPSNDKGVDVVASIELGITSVKEVIQVKRQQANVHRPVLDALRGSLHRFQAVRGTIITLGGFSKGTRETAFDVGAAPITLIDGDRLIDLLTEYRLGVQVREISFLEFAPRHLRFDEADHELDTESAP